MDSENLSKKYPQLISHMNDSGYNREYIRAVKTYIRKVIAVDGDDTIASYEELFQSMDPEHGYLETHHALRARRCLLGIVRDFDLYGKLPDRKRRSYFMSGKSYFKLNTHYRTLIDIYQNHARKSGKRSETIAVETSNGSCFFLHLMNSGAETIGAVTSSQIVSFFHNGQAIVRGHSYRKNLKAVLAGNEDGPYAEECAAVAGLLPCTSAVRKNFPCLRDAEAELLHSYIMDENSREKLRDRLITALAFFYGLRGSDIARFRYDWIDWNKDQIVIIQSKTGERLSLPLLTTIGNMVVDYVRSVPDKKGNTPMFTSFNCCGSQLEFRTISEIVSNFMKRAGVRTEGGMTGVRVLRHHAATTMLRKGVKTPIISSVLGHISPESVVPYIDSSIEDLQSCAIDVSMYPVDSKVFSL